MGIGGRSGIAWVNTNDWHAQPYSSGAVPRCIGDGVLSTGASTTAIPVMTFCAADLT